MEDRLGVANRFRHMEEGLRQTLHALQNGDQAGAKKLVKQLLALEEEENHGL